MAKNILIIGGVAAGMKTAARLRRLAPDFDITVIERGGEVSYGACGFPYYIGDDVTDFTAFTHTPQKIPRDAAYFAKVKGIRTLVRHTAEKINRAAKTVTVLDQATGQRTDMPYDDLVLATGSTPVRLPLPGADLAGIHNFWFPWEAKKVKAELTDQVTDVAIIGAGFIGMELAEAMIKAGRKVHVIEMQSRLLPQMLDQEMADSLLKGLSNSGIDFHLNEKTTAFIGKDGRVNAIATDRGEIPAQLVIVAVGVRPNVELAREAGIEIGPSGAIATDHQLRTSDPHIYAGGDCAENTHVVSGGKVFAPMGSTANKHGRVIAGVLAGTNECYDGVLTTGICQIVDWQAGATGLNETAAQKAGLKYKSVIVPGFDRLSYMPGANRLILKLVAEIGTGRILGAQAIGTGGVDKRIDVVATAIAHGLTIYDVHNIDYGYAPPFNGPIDNVSTACNIMENKLTGHLNGINPRDWQQMKTDSKYTLVDVRTAPEFARNRIKGCANIINVPLGELREKAETLFTDKAAHLVTSCQIDLRGYEAETILRNKGYVNVCSLEGGMSAWPYETEHD